MHFVPRSKRDQSYECNQHAYVQAKVYFEASVVATSVARLDHEADVVRSAFTLTRTLIMNIVIVNRLLIKKYV